MWLRPQCIPLLTPHIWGNNGTAEDPHTSINQRLKLSPMNVVWSANGPCTGHTWRNSSFSYTSVQGHIRIETFSGGPPPFPLSWPKFQPPQSEGASRGLVPLQGSRPLLPLPPQQKWSRTESRPGTPPPPQACPRTLTAGRQMVIEVPPLTERGGHRTASMLGTGTCWVTSSPKQVSPTSQ